MKKAAYVHFLSGYSSWADDLSFKVAPLERITLTHRVMIWIPMTANDRLDTRLPIGFATHPVIFLSPISFLTFLWLFGWVEYSMIMYWPK
jgi:hypothetical protein